MPRATWSGHLRVSLVTCPITLSPAATESERIRLNQINPATGNRISLKPVDAETGEPVERSEIVKGYQYEKGQYVTLDKEELDAIDIESTRILDLTRFVDRASVEPLYPETPYYLYPEGKTGADAYRVIGQALRNTKQVGIGSIVLTSREHPVMVEPYEEGLMMWLLHTPDEVREPAFELPNGKLDPSMVRMAEQIIERLGGKWEPATFHDRYQDALKELIEAKIKGLPRAKRAAAVEPSNVIDLMAALKRSLGEKKAATAAPNAAKPKRTKATDHRQRSMLLPMSGGGKSRASQEERGAENASRGKRRKKAS